MSRKLSHLCYASYLVAFFSAFQSPIFTSAYITEHKNSTVSSRNWCRFEYFWSTVLLAQWACIFNRSGDFQWRDSKTPTEILEDFTYARGISNPKYYGDIGVKVDNKTYNIADFGEICAESSQIKISIQWLLKQA
mgnify:FL=1